MRVRLRDLLLQRGILRQEHVEQATKLGARDGFSLRLAVQHGWCDDEALGRAIGELCEVPYVDLASCELSEELIRLVPPFVMSKHQLVPVKMSGGTLTLIMADPTNIYAQDDVKFLTGYDIEVWTSGPRAIQEFVEESEKGRAWSAHSRRYRLERSAPGGLDEWVLGQAFAFHPRSAGIEFLRDGQTHVLGQVSVTSTWDPLSAQEALFTDRAVYGTRERVHLGLLCASRAGQRVTVEVRFGLSVLPALEVEVDGNGLGWLALPAPPPGNYLLTLGEATASFTVAAYRLSPLQVQWLGQRREGEELVVELRASVLGAPLEGTLVLGLLDGSREPARRVHTARVRTQADGRATARLPLKTEGPASLEVQVEERADLTASVSLPGTARAERQPLTLSRWEETWLASAVPFEGSTPVRGLHVGRTPEGGAAPLRIVEVTHDAVRLEVTRPSPHAQVVGLSAGNAPVLRVLRDAVPGDRIELPLHGPWTLVLAGVFEPGAEGLRCWEGRAAVLVPAWPLEVDAPAQVRPGDQVALTLRGSPGASAWVSVRDTRLTARSATEAAAAALRRDLEDALAWFDDGVRKATLKHHFPERSGRNYDLLAGLDESMEVGSLGAPKPPPPSMSEEPPPVILCQKVTLDAQGLAQVGFRAPRLLGQLEVDVLGVTRGDWASARASLAVHQPVHGELSLPRYMVVGERAVGTLHVRLASGSAEVEVRRDGTPLLLRAGGQSGLRLTLSAPGGEVRFDASPGAFEATLFPVGAEAQRVGGTVEQPGRASWWERTVVVLPAGGRLEVEGREARARITPGVGGTVRRMARALQDYSYSCAEQTSAILLACVTELLLETDRRGELERHLGGLVERLDSMALPSGPFRAYPDHEVSDWLSRSAAAHLLELEVVEPRPSLEPIWATLQHALKLGRKAAAAHRMERAPAHPRTAREALACLHRSPERARELAGQVQAGVGLWEGGLAVLRLGPAGAEAEAGKAHARSPFLSAAEVRAETAYGAAVLLRAGPEFFQVAAPLVRTALSGMEESGRCFSTLDTVGALALLSAMPDGAARTCRVDGEELSLQEALERTALRHIEAGDGPLLVDLERVREENLGTLLRGDTPGTVRLERAPSERGGPLLPGERLELVVRLDADYGVGDLLQVFLPPALAWLHGGTQATGLALDFEGKDTLRVPLVVTGATVDAAGTCVPQRCGVYLRNMYDERRGSEFNALTVRVPPSGAAGGETGPGVLEQRIPGRAEA